MQTESEGQDCHSAESRISADHAGDRRLGCCPAGITAARGGKIRAFLRLFIFPVFAEVLGFDHHVGRSKRTQFADCHIMELYGKSLSVDDQSYIFAAHFQKNRVPRDQACIPVTRITRSTPVASRPRSAACSTFYVQYIATPQQPIKLYQPLLTRW